MVVGGTLHCRYAGLGQQASAAGSRAAQDHRLAGNGTREVGYVVTHRLSVQRAVGSADDMIGGSPRATHKSLALQIAAA